jgi:hypothetical protein
LPGSNTGKHLDMIVTESGDSILYTSFLYDSENRISSFSDTTNNGFARKTTIKYNPQGDPVSFNTTWQEKPLGILYENIDSLVYNMNKQVIKKLFRSSSIPLYKVINAYIYDEKGRLTADTVYGYRSDEVYSYTLYTYDDKDNLVKWERFQPVSGALKSVEVASISYNNEMNVYRPLNLIYYFLGSETFLLSKQNRKQVVYDRPYYNRETERYTYEYDVDGLAKKAVISRDSGGPFAVTNIDFYYK